MLTLPPQFAAITKAAAKETTRYAIDGVLVEERDSGRTSRAVATNGHILAIMEAPNQAKDFPNIFAPDTPNGQMSVVIPTDRYTAAFKKAPRGHLARIKPVLGCIAVQPSETVITIGSTDLESKTVDVCNKLEGSFPPYEDTVPKETPVYRIGLNLEYLIAMAQIAQGVTEDGQPIAVLEFHARKSQPMVIRAENGDQKFTGLVMPAGLDGALAKNEEYDRWEKKLHTVDLAFAALTAVRQYLASLKQTAKLQAIEAQCRTALEAAGPICDAQPA